MNNRVILCPVDYSESTETAISLAVNLAKANDSKIVLLHVIEPDKKAISIDQSIDNRYQERLRKQFLNVFGVKHRLETRHGDPARTTIDYAKQVGADIIVMGTKGRTGLANLVAGSVARKVMAGASCPVVIVKTPAKIANRLSKELYPPARFSRSGKSGSAVEPAFATSS